MSFPISAQLLDACVLAIVARGETYGYELTQRIKQAFDVSESTLYPVLRRLQQDGCLVAHDQPYQGRNRRYYKATPDGLRKLSEYRREWAAFGASIEQILYGGLEP